MTIQNNSTSLYSRAQENPQTYEVKEIKAQLPKSVSLKNFSEKATINFEYLSFGLSLDEKTALTTSLNKIGKAAAFASLNGYQTQSERNIVNQYFGNYEGVLSDEAIKKMIYSKLDNPNLEHREFLSSFAQSLDAPLQSINIRV